MTGVKITIAIDFDGTCVTHEYPKIGRPIGAVEVLKKLIEEGHNLVLFTMRSGKELEEAVNWLNEQGVSLYGINTNPEQHSWTKSPKAYAQLYIDDAALGCPLIHPKDLMQRPYVDWSEVKIMLEELSLI